jgi:hypothetical protein
VAELTAYVHEVNSATKAEEEIMRYMIIVKGDERVEAGEMPRAEDIAAMADFHEELAEAGALVAADGLQPTSKGFGCATTATNARSSTGRLPRRAN